AFSEGLDEMGWVRRMYEEVRADAATRGVATMPGFDEFWARGHLEVPVRGGIVFLEKFRADPAAHPLATESGRIVLSSKLLAERAIPDCPPRPTFLAKDDMLGAERASRYPFHLLSAQPGTR